MVRINAPAKHERPLADFLKRRCKGWTIIEDKAGRRIGGDCGNVLMRVPGTSRGVQPLLLSAHMDTVQPTTGIRPVMRGGMIRSDGKTILGADDRAGIAAILEAVRHVQESGKPHAPLELLFTVAEEIGLLGAKQIPRGFLKSSMGFVLDSSLDVGMAVNDAVSIQRMIAHVHGRPAHAGVEPEKGVNAIAIAAKALSRLRFGRVNARTTMNVGKISGGHTFNIVPAYAAVEMEARSDSARRLAAIVGDVKKAFALAAKKAGGKVRVEDWTDFEMFRVPPSAPVSIVFYRGCKRAGMRGRLRAYSGGSDANVFNKIGVPSLVLGVGYKCPHSTRECISVQSLTDCAKLVASIIEAYGV